MREGGKDIGLEGKKGGGTQDHTKRAARKMEASKSTLEIDVSCQDGI